MCHVTVAAVLGHKAQQQTHHEHRRYRPLAVVSAACAPPFATIGPVTTKVSMVPMVPQVRIKLTSFGEETLVCSEPRVISVV